MTTLKQVYQLVKSSHKRFKVIENDLHVKYMDMFLKIYKTEKEGSNIALGLQMVKRLEPKRKMYMAKRLLSLMLLGHYTLCCYKKTHYAVFPEDIIQPINKKRLRYTSNNAFCLREGVYAERTNVNTPIAFTKMMWVLLYDFLLTNDLSIDDILSQYTDDSLFAELYTEAITRV